MLGRELWTKLSDKNFKDMVMISKKKGSGFRFTSSYIFPMYGTMYIYKGLDAHSMMV